MDPLRFDTADPHARLRKARVCSWYNGGDDGGYDGGDDGGYDGGDVDEGGSPNDGSGYDGGDDYGGDGNDGYGDVGGWGIDDDSESGFSDPSYDYGYDIGDVDEPGSPNYGAIGDVDEPGSPNVGIGGEGWGYFSMFGIDFGLADFGAIERDAAEQSDLTSSDSGAPFTPGDSRKRPAADPKSPEGRADVLRDLIARWKNENGGTDIGFVEELIGGSVFPHTIFTDGLGVPEQVAAEWERRRV